MFGLTFEKLLLVAVIAALILGPTRLPGYAQRLAELVRALRRYADDATRRVQHEVGMDAAQWRQLDPRQYDPRRIIREAFEDSAPAHAAPSPPLEPDAAAPIRLDARHLDPIGPVPVADDRGALASGEPADTDASPVPDDAVADPATTVDSEPPSPAPEPRARTAVAGDLARLAQIKRAQTRTPAA